MMKLNLVLMVALGLFTAGCAKDINADDYLEQQRKRDYAKLQPAAGKYTGNLIALRNGANLGALLMEVTVDTKSQGSAEPGRAQGKTVLRLSLELKGALNATVNAADSFFDPRIGHFSTSIAVKRQAAVPGLPSPPDAVINIDGTISGNTFTGTIDATEGNVRYKEDGASFRLVRNGPSLEEINKASRPDPSVHFTLANYAGTAIFLTTRDDAGKPVRKPVNLVLLKPSQTEPDQDFVELLLPTKPLVATLNFSDTMRLQFTNAKFDRRSGRLTADGSISTVTPSARYEGTVSVRCEGGGGVAGYNCSLLTGGSAEVARIAVKPNQGGTSPTTSSMAMPRTYRYIGRGKFPKRLDSTELVWEKITFVVAYTGKTLEEEILDMIFPTLEKTVNVAFTFTSIAVSGTPSWSSVRYNSLNNSLVASGPGPAIGSVMTLQCSGFKLESPSLGYKFKCNYTNSVLPNVDMPLELKSR